MPMPPLRPSTHDRSWGALTSPAQQSGQQVPASLGLRYWKGGLQSNALQVIPWHVSTE